MQEWLRQRGPICYNQQLRTNVMLIYFNISNLDAMFIKYYTLSNHIFNNVLNPRNVFMINKYSKYYLNVLNRKIYSYTIVCMSLSL